MLFQDFARRLADIEPLSARLAITEELAALFQAVSPEEMPQVCYLLQGRLVPLYQSLEFQLSSKMILKALARIKPEETDLFGQAGELTLQQVTDRYKELGDIGLLAEEVIAANNSQQEGVAPLELSQVFEQLVAIAQQEGIGSQEQKLQLLVTLFTQVSGLSARYVSRIIMGKLRLGFSTKTLLDALSWSVHADKRDSSLLEEAFNRRADVGYIATQYKAAAPTDREKILASIEVETGVPVVPALCQRLNTAQEIIEKMTAVVAEPKYDGMRVQVHINKQHADPAQQIQIFTRNLDNISHMFPELQANLEHIQADQVILDGEAIGYHAATDELLPFQETITRRRKHDVADKAESIPIRFYFFDILSLNNKTVMDEKLQARKELLDNILSENRTIKITNFITTDDAVELHDFHNQMLSEGLEGAVMKQLDSTYRGGRKGWSWVKIKEAEGTTGKLPDTLDCVVMGYYKGRGKRTQFGLGAILVGVLDDASQQVVSIAQIGTGMTESQLAVLKSKAEALETAKIPAQYVPVANILQPDVWLKPELVVEIAADELTKSPTHAARFALRFPRLLKLRADKGPEQVTTLKEVQELVKLQYASSARTT